MSRRQAGQKPIRVRKHGRRQMLVYLDPKLIKTLKKAAVDRDVHLYDIVDDAARAWLERQGSEAGGGTDHK